MSITTKTGDGGQTSLYSGQRVWKDDLRVDAYGSLDELDAHIGDACHLIDDPSLVEKLRQVQNLLYRAMGQLATIGEGFPYPICASDTDLLTGLIQTFEAETPIQGFVIPGSLPSSARLDICRTIARRAERRVISLNRHEPVNPHLMGLVNRLSDLFYIMARHIEDRAGALTYKTRPEQSGCPGNED